MIDLMLTESEARCLEDALARRAAELMNELVHTSDRAAHAELKVSSDELEALQRRVAGALSWPMHR